MSRRLLVGLVAMALAAAAYGAQMPEAGKQDPRIRFATYDPHDVVTILTGIGLETHIVLEPDERIVDMAGGDREAWGLESTAEPNGVFIKPAGELADSNIHIRTNKNRTYTFAMRLAKKTKGEVGFLTVFFRYPAAAQAENQAAKQAEQVRTLLEAGTPVGNRRYTVQGSSDLAPVEVWDDGRSTFFRFRARASIPAIYTVRDGDDSLEQIENVNTRSDVVQVHGVRRKFMLRVGGEVACVFNEAFNPNAARPATNTASPAVNRVLKGAGK